LWGAGESDFFISRLTTPFEKKKHRDRGDKRERKKVRRTDREEMIGETSVCGERVAFDQQIETKKGEEKEVKERVKRRASN